MTSSTLANENGTATQVTEPQINSNQTDVDYFPDSAFPDNDNAKSSPGAPGNPGKPPCPDEATLIAEIHLHWNKSFDSILEVGRLLNEAALTLSKKGSRKKFVSKLPFSYSVCQRLRKLAKSTRINDPKHRARLPYSWNTLAAIDNLPEEVFQVGLEKGTINAQSQYKHIKALREEEDRAYNAAARAKVVGDSVSAGCTVPRKKVGIAADLRRKQEAMRNKPRPLFVRIAADVVDAHGPELATLIEEIQSLVMGKYSFISEVRMER